MLFYPKTWVACVLLACISSDAAVVLVPRDIIARDTTTSAAPSFLPPLPPLSAVNSLLPPLPPASSLFPSLPPASSLFPSLPPISSLLPSLPPPGSILPPLPSSLLPPLSNSSASTNSGDNTNLGAIIGGVVGGFCGFVLLLAAFLFWFFRRRLLGRTAYGGSEADLAAKEAADGYRGSSEKTVDVASPRDPRFQDPYNSAGVPSQDIFQQRTSHYQGYSDSNV